MFTPCSSAHPPDDRVSLLSAILTIYLRNELGYSDDTATVVYHTFNMFCYFTPILGAILADTILGKFKYVR